MLTYRACYLILKYMVEERKSIRSAFTLIELLVVISIIGILIALSIFGLQGARQSARDSRRKADLELIRSGLEIYKSDCTRYPSPASGNLIPNPLMGTGTSSTCLSTNTYISLTPTDPVPPRTYFYSSSGTTYVLCAALEQAPNPAVGTSGCGSCGVTCNYKVTNP